MPFRPAPVPTIAAAGALVVLVNLSAWQYRRHVASQTQTADVQERLKGPPLTNDDLGRNDLAWHKADLVGTYLEQTSFVAGSFQFGGPGYDLITPFRVTGGPTLLVHRGWIPSHEWQANELAARPTAGPTRIEGLLLDIDGESSLKPLEASETSPERWAMETARIGLLPTVVGPPYAAIAATSGLELASFYLVVGPELQQGQARSPEPLPVTGYVAKPKQIGHLSYSGQWAMIALVLVSLWSYAGFRRGARLEA